MKEMDQFLEVLLEGFQLTRRDGARGVELSVAFDNNTPFIRNRQDRESVRGGMGAHYDAVVEEYQRRLHLAMGERGYASHPQQGRPELLLPVLSRHLSNRLEHSQRRVRFPQRAAGSLASDGTRAR
jgi:hypothetical protein